MSNKTNLVLDLTIFTVFLVVYNPRLTGNTIHEWLSVAFGAAIVTHLLLHWKWIASVTTDYFKKFFHRSRLNYIVDLLFFIAMTGSLFSGLMISKDVLSTLGIQIGEVSRGWKSIHTLTSDASLILLGIHVALHWKWVVSNMSRYIVTPVARLFRRQPDTLLAQPVRINEEQ
jgi:hypothetical protein